MLHPKRSILFALLTAAAALTFGAPAALAQHDHGGKPGEKHAAPKTYAEAIAEIDEHLEGIDKLIKANKLDDVHGEAQTIVDVANTLAALALKTGSGVPKEAVKDINKTAKELAGKFDAIDKAGDSGDAAGTTKVYNEMVALQATLKKYAPAGGAAGEHAHDSYYCPMHCEGTKTYDQPGKCPKCGMNLKKQTTDKFTVDIKPVGLAGGKIEVGKPVNLLFTLKDPTGLPLKKVEVVHEKPLHLLMVSKDLSWYAHEHPVLQPDGTFTFTYTFPAAGEFFFYNDFTPPNVGQQVVTVPVTVAGTAPAAKALTVDAGTPKTIEGYTVALDTGGPVKTGAATHMAYTVSKDGKPVTTLAPYLGAMGHLVIISEDRKEFVHSHPHDSEGHTSGGPKVDFEATFAVPGTYKGWAQFNVGTTAKEQVITVPFTFTVTKGDGKDAAPDGHKHGAKPVNGMCPITREVADAAFTRDFKGQLVGFKDAASATTWDGLKDDERLTKFVAALAAAVPGEHDDGMPAGLQDAEARKLYLTPGGKYTEADIKANGSVTADAKFKGVMSKHDFKPKPGDTICPITLTKVNPKFTWIIGGKTYQFCCPPCIDEFVLLAKESPEEIKEPSFYVKK